MCAKWHFTIMCNTNFTSHPQDTTLSKVPYIKADASIVSGYGIIVRSLAHMGIGKFSLYLRITLWWERKKNSVIEDTTSSRLKRGK